MSGPMDENAEVGLTLTEGPICGLGDDEIAASYPLWDSIVAAESFPPGAGASGANYIVSLKKGVNHVNEVRPAEDELTKAFQMLAAAWPFSGGSYLIIETREVVCSPRLASNADDIEQEMLSRSGLTRVVSTSRAPLGWSAPYSQAPLCLAVRIAQSMRSDFQTRKLLFYHQQAAIERGHPSWFVSLYKVRDFLCKVYKCENAARAALGISKNKWKYFGKLLNENDLRHAEITGSVPSVSHEEISKLYQLAHRWAASYLRKAKSLPALG
jgi:hypothetical protein